jgi:NUC153 domain
MLNLDVQEEFKIDLTDPRFAPLIQDHEYFIDPTNPQ